MNVKASAKGLNEAWVERRAKAVSRGMGMAAPVIAARAEDSELWDIEGRRYIDFGGGIAVLNTGHRHPAVMKRVQEQLNSFTHTCFTIPPYAPFIELAQKFKADVEPSRVAAIVIEPVQGEGGFYIAPKELMTALRRICDEHGIVFIADEIQSGFGRTGKWFAMEHMGVEPDLMTVAKSLAGGFPLSGVVGRAKIMDAPEPGGLGGTYAGNPVACAAALGVFDAFEQDKLLEKAKVQGQIMLERLKAIKARNKGMPMGDIRSLGAMCAFELVTERGGDKPDAA